MDHIAKQTRAHHNVCLVVENSTLGIKCAALRNVTQLEKKFITKIIPTLRNAKER